MGFLGFWVFLGFIFWVFRYSNDVCLLLLTLHDADLMCICIFGQGVVDYTLTKEATTTVETFGFLTPEHNIAKDEILRKVKAERERKKKERKKLSKQRSP